VRGLLATTVIVALSVGPCENAIKSAGGELHSAQSAAEARAVLDQLANADPVGEAVRSAFCSVLTTSINNNSLPTGDQWAGMIAGEAQQQALGVSVTEIQDKADQFAAAAELAQMSPQAAVRYAQGCRLFAVP
jgi:hypothetical protein